MGKEFIVTNRAPKPGGPYAQGIKSGPLFFVAGQGPVDPKTGKRASDIETQTRQTMLNVKAILEEGGYDLGDVVKMTVYLKHGSDFQRMNEVYRDFFARKPPTRTTVVVNFVNSEMLIEIDAIAYKE